MHRQERALVREAANWFAQMHGPDAAQHEPDFRAWIAQSEAHRDAYSRVSEAFSLGKNLTREVALDQTGPRAAPQARRLQQFAGLVALVIAVGGASLAVERYGAPGVLQHSPIAEVDQFVTRTGEIRTVRLSDGSTITLDTGSELKAQLGADRRDLWLVHGRARFDVAHERRPFVVHAGTGTVTAHGTLFDVRVDHGAASVRLLRGAIDVDIPRRGNTPPMSRHVAPGETVSFDADRGIATIPAEQIAAMVQPTWPAALLEFDRGRVADVIAEANRYAAGHQIVASPDIADKRVSGTFRVGDSNRLVEHLAILLDVDVDHLANGDIVLGKAAP